MGLLFRGVGLRLGGRGDGRERVGHVVQGRPARGRDVGVCIKLPHEGGERTEAAGQPGFRIRNELRSKGAVRSFCPAPSGR